MRQLRAIKHGHLFLNMIFYHYLSYSKEHPRNNKVSIVKLDSLKNNRNNT